MTDDQGYGAPCDLRRRDPDARRWTRSLQEGLRYTNFHSTSLCSSTRAALITGRNHHSAGFGVVGEIGNRLPGLRLDHPPENGHDRPNPQGQRLRHLVVRQEPQHARSTRRARPAPSTSGRTAMGFEYFYGFVGGDASQWQPNLFRNTTAIYPVRGQSRLEPDHRDGRRGDRLHDDAEGGRAGEALLRLLRAGRNPCAAPPDAGMGQEDQRRCTCSTTAGTSCARPIFANQKRLGHHARDGQADRLAGQDACREVGRRSERGSRRSSSSGRPTSTAPISPIPTTRSAGSSRPSRTWASATTR